jgi:MFE-2 hydratase 2 N-terminal domain
LLEVLDKGKAATVTIISETKDKVSGEVIFENQSTVILRGAGGFGGKKTGKGEWALYNITQRRLIRLGEIVGLPPLQTHLRRGGPMLSWRRRRALLNQHCIGM